MDNNIPTGYNSDGRRGLGYIDLSERSKPTKKMLQKDTEWLVELVTKPKEDFIELAKGLVMRQEDWDLFWKEIHRIKLNKNN